MTATGRAAAALAALLALAGCSGGGGSAAPALTPPAVGSPAPPPSGREGMVALPLSAYGLDRDQDARQQQAVRALTADCMHTAGYTAFTRDDAFESSSGQVSDASAMPAGAFGYLRAEIAAVQGFHGPVPTAPPKAPKPPASEAEGAATQECVKKALAAVQPSDTSGAGLVKGLFGQSLEATGRDGRVVGATRAWADCMKAAGFPDVTPEGLVTRYHGPGRPSPEELAAATADERCTAGSNLAGIWFAVAAGYQQQLIAANQEKLTAYQKSVAEQTAKLTRLVGG